MSTQDTIHFDNLGNKMRPRLMRLNRLKRVIRCLTMIVYSATLCWFAYCFLITFSGGQMMFEQTADTWIYVLAVFFTFLILNYSLSYSLTLLKEKEMGIMREAIRQMFPNATLRTNKSVPCRVLADSALFEVSDDGDDNNPVWTTSYGCVEFRGDDHNTYVYDIGVTSDRQAGIMENIPMLGSLLMLYRSIVRPIFGTPIDSTLHSFRGMFGYCHLRRSFRGRVVLLPDHLENKIGYMAQTIQRIRQKYGTKFVHLEDPEFEDLFVVYADDEVEARMILTPAMMRKLTELRKSFSRDLMLSFNGNMFYYASSTPDGFLRPGRKSLSNEHLLEQLYHEINFCRNIEQEMT